MKEKFEELNETNNANTEAKYDSFYENEIAEETILKENAHNDLVEALGINGDEELFTLSFEGASEEGPEYKGVLTKQELAEQQIRETPIKRYGVTEPVAENFLDEEVVDEEKESFLSERAFKDKPSIETDSKPELEYSVKELTFMQECARYNDILNKELGDKIRQHRPVFSGSPLTDQEVLEQVRKYQAYQDKKKKNILDTTPYSKEDKELMIQCSVWHDFYKQFSSRQTTPVGADRLPLKNKEISEVAQKYYKFRNEYPEQFAILKYEKKEWNRGIFRWQAEEHNGKKQWSSVVPSVTTDDLGNRKEIETKYILTEEPAEIDKDGAYYYFTVNNRMVSKANGTPLVFIDLKYPLVKKEKDIQSGQANKVA